jgi:hypothetical protein
MTSSSNEDDDEFLEAYPVKHQAPKFKEGPRLHESDEDIPSTSPKTTKKSDKECSCPQRKRLLKYKEIGKGNTMG